MDRPLLTSATVRPVLPARRKSYRTIDGRPRLPTRRRHPVELFPVSLEKIGSANVPKRDSVRLRETERSEGRAIMYPMKDSGPPSTKTRNLTTPKDRLLGPFAMLLNGGECPDHED